MVSYFVLRSWWCAVSCIAGLEDCEQEQASCFINNIAVMITNICNYSYPIAGDSQRATGKRLKHLISSSTTSQSQRDPPRIRNDLPAAMSPAARPSPTNYASRQQTTRPRRSHHLATLPPLTILPLSYFHSTDNASAVDNSHRS